MEDTKKGKQIRFLFIIVIYNFILATMSYVIDFVNDTFFGYQWQNWDISSWWLFISVIVGIGGFMAYMAPYLERFLYVKLERLEKKLNTIKEKK
jgi:hypothetical protein